jgi:hypothetical protein
VGEDRSKGETAPVVLSNWAFQRVGSVLVLCSVGSSPPPERDFAVWLERISRRDFDRMLIYSSGGEPSGTQRSRIAQVWNTGGRIPHVVLMTDSLVTRSMLTAFHWLMRETKMKATSLSEFDAAFEWLDALADSQDLAGTIARLRAALLLQQCQSPD